LHATQTVAAFCHPQNTFTLECDKNSSSQEISISRRIAHNRPTLGLPYAPKKCLQFHVLIPGVKIQPVNVDMAA